MGFSLLERAKEFLRAQRKKNIWYRTMCGLAAVVVFVTTYMLILPAITLEKETICGKEAHTHTEECYEEVIIAPQKVLNCTEKALGIHEHEDECYDSDHNLICGYADFVVHTHDENCYDEDEKLVCDLPEIKEHEHTASCYKEEQNLTCGQEESEGHQHSDDCYTKEQGDLTCGTEEHTHIDSCKDADGNYICEKEEHIHDNNCYKWIPKLICTQEESTGHTHTDACYETVKTLTCDEQEAIPHTHTEGCYENGTLACGKLEVKEHQHTEECFEAKGGETTEKTLICGIEEHTHDESCYAEDDEREDENSVASEVEAGNDKAEENDNVKETVEEGATEEVFGSESEEEQTAEETLATEIDSESEENLSSNEEIMEDDSWCIVEKHEEEQNETASSSKSRLKSIKQNNSTSTYASSDVQGTDFGQYITNINVSKLVNGNWVQSDEFSDGDMVNVSLQYTIPSGIVTPNNKVIYYQLPDGIRPLKQESGIVYHDGVNVGTYTIREDGVIVIEFSDSFADGRSFDGTLQFKGTVSAEGADENGKIVFGGSGTTITIQQEEEQYDISVKKEGTVSDDDKSVTYVVTASSTNGTEGTVTIEDKFGSGSAEGRYNADSFKIYKIDANGNQSEITGYTPVISTNGGIQAFKIENLPKLEAGEAYKVDYSASVLVSGGNGSAKLQNSAGATSGKNNQWVWNEVEISKTMIYKEGWYDKEKGVIHWTIKVNEDRKNIGGYTLSDILPDGLKFSSDITITGSDGNYSTVSMESNDSELNYTFPDGASDFYTITFDTTAPAGDGNVTNNASISHSDQSYSSSGNVNVAHRDMDVNKYWNTEDTSKNDGRKRYQWKSTITLPESSFGTFTYIDTIGNAQDADGNDQGNDSHYAFASELQSALENSLQLYLSDGTTLGYINDKVNFVIKYFDTKGVEIASDNSNTLVKKFTIEVSQKSGEADVVGSKLEMMYSTIVDYSGMESGETWKFPNSGSVGEHKTNAGHEYTKPMPLEKLVFGKDQWGNGFYTGESMTVAYDAVDGILSYHLLLRTEPGNNNAITVTDVLPEGTALVNGSLEVKFYYNDNYFGDKIDWYGENSGSYIMADHTRYEVNDNTITIYIDSGYNNDDTGKKSGNVIIVLYQLSVADDPLWNDLSQEKHDYTNRVIWESFSDEQTTTVERTVDKVSKTGAQLKDENGNVTNVVEYNVVINPAGSDLDPHSDTLTLTDTMSVPSNIGGAYLQLGKLHIHRYDTTAENCQGSEVDSSLYQVRYDESTHKMTIVLPDELACILVYEYTIDSGTANTPQLSNSVTLSGGYEYSNEIKLEDTSSSASVTKGMVTVYKVDSEDYSKRLQGAKFSIEYYDKNSNVWVKLENTYSTNENGELQINDSAAGENSINLDFDLLYRLKETKAPTGYSASEKYYYLAWMKTGDTQDTTYQTIGGSSAGIAQSDITFFGAAGGTLYVPNEYTSVSVKKVWVDKDENTIDAPVDSIQVQLKQHTMKPDGYVVKIARSYLISYDGQRNVETDEIIVAKNSTIVITTRDGTNDDKDEFSIKKNDIPFGTVEKMGDSYAQIRFTSSIITEDCTIDIDCRWLKDVVYEYSNPDSNKNIGTVNYDQPVTLLNNNSWSYTWENLPSTDTESGNSYLYTVEEITDLNNCTISYTNNEGIQKGEIVIKNKVTNQEYQLPETGGPGTRIAYTLGSILMLLASAAFLYIKKKNDGKKGGLA